MREVNTRAMAAGNRERAMVALNNLGVAAGDRKDYALAREYLQQALALARKIGAQQSIALYYINLADCNIQLGQLATARTDLHTALSLALRLGTRPRVVSAVTCFADLIYAEGQAERALALLGLARQQPAWSNHNQHELDATLAEWALDPAVVAAGLKAGAALDWETTIQELLSAP